MRKRNPPSKPPVDALVWSVPQTCERTNLSRATIYRAMDAGHLRFLKYGSRRMITPEDAKDFVASMRARAG